MQDALQVAMKESTGVEEVDGARGTVRDTAKRCAKFVCWALVARFCTAGGELILASQKKGREQHSQRNPQLATARLTALLGIQQVAQARHFAQSLLRRHCGAAS